MNYYTLQQVVNRSGLSEHTLRYYERIGLLDRINRDFSSGHRRYSDEDVTTIEALACLRATGMPIDEMRKYRVLLKQGKAGAAQQVALFEAHKKELELEIAKKKEHLEYLAQKIAFWKAVKAGKQVQVSNVRKITARYAKKFKREPRKHSGKGFNERGE